MSRRRRDDRSRRGKVYNEHDADIVRELEEIEDAIEAGSAEMLMEVAQRLSRDQIFEIQESRWKKLLGFLGKGNQKLTQEQKIKKMRLVRERMKLEMDITKVLEFMYKEKR